MSLPKYEPEDGHIIAKSALTGMLSASSLLIFKLPLISQCFQRFAQVTTDAMLQVQIG
jgi:hypothetical protein